MTIDSSSNANSKTYDLVIYGATGFTGKLASEYVRKNYHSKVKYALAGRSRSKLEKVRDSLLQTSKNGKDSNDMNDIPLIVADAKDEDAIDKLVSSTKVIANYAGTPFIDKALPIVKACVKHGTCYTDITGEVPFHRASYDLFHQQAVDSGALILHQCGYDSIPSDVGAYLAADAMKQKYNRDCKSIRTVVGESKGGLSGGTLYTMLDMVLGKQDQKPGVKESKKLGSYSLDPKGGRGGPDTKDGPSSAMGEYDNVSKTYVMPFIMAACNAPLVRKSNALLSYKYGKDCSYTEVLAVSNRFAGFAGLFGLGFFGLLIAFPPTRYLLLKFALPKPGEGPSKELQETGFFKHKTYAVGEVDEKDKGPVVAESYFNSGNAGDPGYKATARMSIEASLCMALEREKCSQPTVGGVLTPASALGMCLVNRLNASGMNIGIVDS